MTSVKSVWKCLSAVHREVHQAHPDVDVVKGYVGAFLDEVDLLRGQNTPKPSSTIMPLPVMCQGP
jgi:hypothetical protein